MTTQTESITIRVELPRDEYERVETLARKEHRTAADIIPLLIEDGLQSRMTAREIMEQVSKDYRARIAASAEHELTSEELLVKLRRDREEIANERYP